MTLKVKTPVAEKVVPGWIITVRGQKIPLPDKARLRLTWDRSYKQWVIETYVPQQRFGRAILLFASLSEMDWRQCQAAMMEMVASAKPRKEF